MKNRLQSTQPQMIMPPTLNPIRHTIRHFLGAMRRHDPSLIEHGKRTAVYSLLLGQILQLPDQDLSDLTYAGLLHELGKLTLPNEVIHQHGISMIGEYVMTECSPKAGAEILHSWPGLQEIAKLIALHHERWDGNGDPFGMRGDLIPLGARILSLTDTVDQLLTQKNGLIGQQIDSVVRIIRLMSGTRFDPNVVEVFCKELAPFMKAFGDHFSADSPWLSEQIMANFGRRLNIKKNFLTRHLENIFEISNPISCNSAPTLCGR